jgi:ornithine cyclodeaminase
LAVLDGNEITSFRTSAASALAASFLARHDARRQLVIGCGRVGSLVARAMSAVRDIASIELWDTNRHAAQRCRDELHALGIAAVVADDLEHAVRKADIVSCATLSNTPIVHAEWLAPGSHLDLIGSFTPTMQEAHPDCFRNAAVFVDTSEAQQKSGDLLRAFETGALVSDAIRGDLFGLCRKTVPGREDSQQRTVFKSVGTALEDLVAGTLVYLSATGAI